MPGMDGPTLLKHARGYLGDAPVMFISGYAEAEFSDLLEGETGVSFLAKPIDIPSGPAAQGPVRFLRTIRGVVQRVSHDVIVGVGVQN